MPEAYEKIKASLRKQHPNWSDAHIKTSAAKIYNSKRPSGAAPVTGKHKAK